MKTRQTIFLVNTMAHSRDVTMLLNEISLRFGCTITKYVELFVYCFMPHRVKWNKICKKKYISCVLGVDGKIHPEAVVQQAESPPMRQEARGMDFSIHTRNTWRILIVCIINFTYAWPEWRCAEFWIVMLPLYCSWTSRTWLLPESRRLCTIWIVVDVPAKTFQMTSCYNNHADLLNKCINCAAL